MPLHDLIDIGVFTGKGEEKPLYLKKEWLTTATRLSKSSSTSRPRAPASIPTTS